jgi:ribosome-binding factor A
MGNILQRKYADKFGALVTVTEVRTSGDLRHAKVFVAVLAEKDQQSDIIKRLQHKRQDLRQDLAERIVLKYVPTLDIRIDDSAERASRIEELLIHAKPDQET